MVTLSIPMLAVAGWRAKRHATRVNLGGRNRIWLLLGGLSMALSMLAHFHAIEHAPVSYMIAVKRTSLIFSVVYGALIFREERIRQRLLGTSIMLSGAVMLYLAT